MHKCEECGRTFKNSHGLHIHKAQAHGLVKQCGPVVYCAACGAEIKGLKPYLRNRSEHHFCDKKCKGRWQREHLLGNANPCWRGGQAALTCCICGGTKSEWSSQIINADRVVCSPECRRELVRRDMTAENNHQWQGGIASERGNWYTHGGEDWAKHIYARAHFHCERCGERGTLHAHHHWGFTLYPQWRSELWNGICLCEDCHRHLHSLAGYAERWTLAWEAFERHQREALELVPLALPAVA